MDHYTFPNPNSSPTTTTTTSSSSSSFHSHNKRTGGNTKKRSTTSKSTSKLSTDPQSVVARERRHRISDRFKILGTMVPGGSKMDTVSMLDEAISYVKFLKAQIWFHNNMLDLFLNDDMHDKTTSCNDDYVPGSELYSQEVPVMVTTDSGWFGSVDDEVEETMHRRRGLS